jgi:post-segregation antitoxin (ccd killing protein)
MTTGHMSDQARWDLEEPMLRYRSHARACEMNAASTKDGLLNQVNRERAKRWHQRADEAAAKLKAYDDAKAQS